MQHTKQNPYESYFYPPPRRFYLLQTLLWLGSPGYLSAQTLVNVANQFTFSQATQQDFLVGAKIEMSDTSAFILYNEQVTAQYHTFAVFRNSLTHDSTYWVTMFDTLTPYMNHGTDLYVKNNKVYVCAAAVDSANGAATLYTIQLNAATGAVDWVSSYTPAYNGYVLPTAILADGSGNVYTCGTEQTATSDYRMVLLKHNSSGTQQWVSGYDSVGRYDGAAGIRISSNRLYLTGFSGTGFSSWDFVTISFNATNGTASSVQYSANATGGFSTPVDIHKDQWDNLYVLGTATNAYGNTDIKLIKYDSLFTQKWVRTFGDSLLPDEAAAMLNMYSLDGRIALCGTKYNALGGSSAWVAELDTGGTLLWQQTLAPAQPGYQTIAKEIDYDNNNNIIVASTTYNGANRDVVATSFSPTGTLRWYKQWHREADTDDEANDIGIGPNNYVHVSYTSRSSTDTVFGVFALEEWEIPNNFIVDTNNQPVYRANELIVRFNPDIISPLFVNNRDVIFTELQYIIPDSVLLLMNSKTGLPLDRAKVSKIFKQLTTADSLSITREGDTIYMPKFWSSVLLHIPQWVSDTLPDIQDSLNTIPQYVFNTGKNLIIQFTSYPDDPEFPTTNGHYGNNYNSLCDATQGINVCPVWDDGETGYSGVNIGIFDTGLNYGHEELLNSSHTISKANQGYDFDNGWNITVSGQFNDTYNGGDGHGTGVACIAAGLSNNGLGGTGVAGGDQNGLTQNWGCLLVAMKIANGNTAKLYEALVMGATNTPMSGIPGFGIDIANMSITVAQDGNTMAIADKRALQDAMRWLYQNGVVCVASSGLCGTAFANAVPASLRDNWAIKVAGSTNSGVGNALCPSGNLVDVIAPSEANQFIMASAQGSDQYLNVNPGGSYFGTSFSVPLVSGAAGLLMSYSFVNAGGFILSPDDIENLFEIYAKNNQLGSTYGHGLLDVGNAYNHIKYPAYKIYHYTVQPPNSTNVTKVHSNYNITLTDNFEKATSNTFGSPTVFLQAGNYVADVYEIGSNVTSWQIPVGESIVNHWKNNRKTTLWKAPDGSNKVEPENDYDIISFNSNGGTLKGYAYFIISDGNGNPVNKWVPVDVSGNNFGNGKVGISIHTYNSALGVGDELENSSSAIQIYPNPSSNTLNVTVTGFHYESCEATIYDIAGSKVWESQLKLNNDLNKFLIDISSYKQGVYIFEIKNTKHKEQAKIIVCH